MVGDSEMSLLSVPRDKLKKMRDMDSGIVKRESLNEILVSERRLPQKLVTCAFQDSYCSFLDAHCHWRWSRQ